MNHKDQTDELVELGVATDETKGGAWGFVDSDRTLQPHPGLSDE